MTYKSEIYSALLFGVDDTPDHLWARIRPARRLRHERRVYCFLRAHGKFSEERRQRYEATMNRKFSKRIAP